MCSNQGKQNADGKYTFKGAPRHAHHLSFDVRTAMALIAHEMLYEDRLSGRLCEDFVIKDVDGLLRRPWMDCLDV